MRHLLVTDSSNVASLGFDLETNAMEVTFKSGATYRYADVPRETFMQIAFGKSVGSGVSTLLVKAGFKGEIVKSPHGEKPMNDDLSEKLQASVEPKES